MSDSQTDMTHGPLTGKIIAFALPYALSGIVEQLFNSINIAVVGHFADSHALAAVGATTFLISLIINLFMGISIGANAVIANYIGRRERLGIRKAVSTTITLAVIIGFMLMAVGIAVSAPMLRLLNTPAEVLGDATLYLRIYFIGAPFFVMYNFAAAILRSKGDTKSPLYILIIGGVINAGMSMLLVIAFKLSVAGVATATTMANLSCAAAVVQKLRHENGDFRVTMKKMHIYREEMRRILMIGLPAGLQGMVFALSNVFVQSAVNSYGYAAIAGTSICVTFDTYCYYLLSAFCAAAITFTGQNYGAGHTDRCNRIFRICLLFGWGSCFVGNMLFYIFADQALALFTVDPKVIYYAKWRIATALVFQSIAAGYEVPAAAMRGFGQSLTPALLTILGTCVLRLAWIFFVHPYWPGYGHLMLCYPLSWTATSLLVGTTYFFARRKAYAVLQANT